MISPRPETRPLTPKQVRTIGWVLIGLGAFLTIFMVWIAAVIIGVMIHSDDPNATTRFTGGPAMKAFTLGIFGLVIAFGLLCILNGAWQVRYSKRNPHLVQWTVWCVSGFGLIGVIVGFLEMFE
ncbi:MAG: hypothetical protein JNK48_08295 [Bryobacterales bacterium]|nr:hypothetical protein [Bryobacterales bacterium]